MNSVRPPQLPFDLLEAILLPRLADHYHQYRSLDLQALHQSRLARPGNRVWYQQHLSAKRNLPNQAVACLCAVTPSRAMCLSAARLPGLGLVSACRDGHIARLDKLHQLGLCTDPYGRALEGAITNNHVAVLEWWTQHSLPIVDYASVGSSLECGAFDAAKWIAEHRVPALAQVPLDALQRAIRRGRVDVVHAWLDWNEATLEGDFGSVLEAASEYACVDILERIRIEHEARFLEVVAPGNLLERLLADDNASVVEWWIDAALAHGMAARAKRVASMCVQVASEQGRVEVLQVWRQSGVPFKLFKLA